MSLTRRSFLQASLVGTSVLLGRLAIPVRAAAALPPGELSLYNTHTAERLAVTFRDGSGNYDPTALRAIDRILRCHYTGEVVEIDRRVIEFVNQVDKALGSGGHEISIISGYRSPVYNEWLASHGHGVAKHSLHLEGRALDVRLAGVGLDTLRRTALGMQVGGVGYYPSSDFVHLDSGRVRTW